MMWGWPNMMGGYFGGMGWIGIILGFVFFIAIIIGIILLIVWIVKRTTHGSSEIKSESKALETLKERYAKGEITKEKYDEMKKEIQS